jgi:hypothetical protein
VPLDLAELALLERQRRQLTALRNLPLLLDSTLDEQVPRPDPEYASSTGRWATESGTIYTATTPRCCWAEYCRHQAQSIAAADPTGGAGLTKEMLDALGNEPLGDPLPVRGLVWITCEFDGLVDITTARAQQQLVRAGFDLRELYADHHEACEELARAGERLSWQALCAPSAAYQKSPPGFCVAIFAAGQAAIRDWEVLEARARPTILHAVMTTYKDGERPAWLG